MISISTLVGRRAPTHVIALTCATPTVPQVLQPAVLSVLAEHPGYNIPTPPIPQHIQDSSPPLIPHPPPPMHSGPVHVRSQLRLLVSMWRGSFPRSMRELSSEQAGGSLASWLATLENRAGALSCEWLYSYSYYTALMGSWL